MTDKDNITHIRALFESYYSGAITPGERDELLELLQDNSALPDDLAMEKEVILSIETIPDIPVPNDLSQRIDVAIAGSGKKNLSGKWKALFYTSVAASVALIMTMVWNAVDIAVTPADFQEQTGTLTAQFSSDEPYDVKEVTSDTKHETEQALAAASLVKSSEPMPNKITRGSHTPAKSHSGNVRIVTDQNEADMILNHVLGIISENMYAAERACDRPEIIIESMNQTISRTDL